MRQGEIRRRASANVLLGRTQILHQCHPHVAGALALRWYSIRTGRENVDDHNEKQEARGRVEESSAMGRELKELPPTTASSGRVRAFWKPCSDVGTWGSGFPEPSLWWLGRWGQEGGQDSGEGVKRTPYEPIYFHPSYLSFFSLETILGICWS